MILLLCFFIICMIAIIVKAPSVLKRHPKGTYKLYYAILIITPMMLFLIMELSWYGGLYQIGIIPLILNAVIYTAFVVIVALIPKKSGSWVYGLYILVLFAALANYFVLSFRGTVVVPSDLYSIRTATTVASQYSYKLDYNIAVSIFLALCMIGSIFAINRSGLIIREYKRTIWFNIATIFLIGCSLVISYQYVDCFDLCHQELDGFFPNYNYTAMGCIPGFFGFLQKSKIEVPKDYSVEKAEEILSGTENEGKATAEKIKPTVIVIMNESFSDLRALGPLKCVEKDIAFFRRLKKDRGTMTFGRCYVSTRGGGTAKTEFEFLTGFSMMEMPNTVPYSVLDFNNIPSIVKTYKENGYHTVAMHPENAFNYNRNRVYPQMGFDEFLSIDDFDGYDTTIYDRVSDQGDYDKLMDYLQENKDPSFIFNVTMQNHGGYEEIEELHGETVKVDKAYRKYDSFVMYESLIKKSDDALKQLIKKLKKIDRPIILCFFGDHQPTLTPEFEEELLSKGRTRRDTEFSLEQKKFEVPYLIWSNYKNEQNSISTSSKTGEVTSPNYLGLQVESLSGVTMTRFENYCLATRDSISAMNMAGYLDSKLIWHDYDNNPRELEEYKIVQYDALMNNQKNSGYYNVKQ